MGHVFISHVEEDSALALPLAEGLEAAGFKTWYYERDSLPGHSYLIQTGQAIEDAAAVIVIISPRSIKSAQVTKEIIRGSEAEKPFIPLLCDMSHAEFQRRQPEWREALGSAASLAIPGDGIAKIVPRIVASLAAMQVERTKLGTLVPPPRQAEAPPHSPSRMRQGRNTAWEYVLLGCVLLISFGFSMFRLYRARERVAPQKVVTSDAKWLMVGSGIFEVGSRRVFRGVGIVGLIENRALATATANLRACGEIGKIQSTLISSLSRSYSSGQATVDEQQVESYMKLFSTATLEGPAIMRHWSDPAEGNHYSLCEISDDMFLSQLESSVKDAGLRNYIKANIRKALDDIAAEEAKH